ncbi:Gim5A protein, putative,glycosomal membrane protein, putative [Trypanosoma cruzi marinkellei]|uniref:Gim5A protein, putative,glycosomal membrane protein, putative n=1 Tax=Trypanosoma cruzi marinkellei TaxID=85056 RepID=K2N1A3_TRYCR|nr:Gim5A protein, putative,glycosomal membrane protein, putative [Trypanosoma cruzi marinkellei]
MSACAHAYLSDTWNRDKVMAIVQFLPMALEGPVRNAGCDSLAESLGNLSKMADAYRAVTRLSLLLNALSSKTLKALAKPKEDALVWRLEQVSHAFHIGFCLNEHTAVLAGRGVLNSGLTRIGGVAVVCWLYTLLLGIARQAYLLAKHSPRGSCKALVPEDAEKKVVPYTHEECKRAVVNLVKMSCFAVFAMTCLPEGRPKLLQDVCGPLVPLHELIRAIAPNKLHLSDTVRGLLAATASLCDFY